MGNMEKPRKSVGKQLRQTRKTHRKDGNPIWTNLSTTGHGWEVMGFTQLDEDFTNHFCGDFMTIWGHDVPFFMARNMAKSRWFTGKSLSFRGKIVFFHGKIIRSLGSQATVEGVRELGDMAAALSAICLRLGHSVEIYWRRNQLFGSCRCFLCISYMDIYINIYIYILYTYILDIHLLHM